MRSAILLSLMDSVELLLLGPAAAFPQLIPAHFI